MSKQFTHIKINPLGFMLDESFDKNMQEALRQKQVAESAPDLLEALRDLVSAEGLPKGFANRQMLIDAAREAIDKAEGKA